MCNHPKKYKPLIDFDVRSRRNISYQQIIIRPKSLPQCSTKCIYFGRSSVFLRFRPFVTSECGGLIDARDFSDLNIRTHNFVFAKTSSNDYKYHCFVIYPLKSINIRTFKLNGFKKPLGSFSTIGY